MKKRILALVMLLVMALMMTGCSSGDQAGNASLQVVVLAPYVQEEKVQALMDALNAALPQLTTDTAHLVMNSISAGYSDTDPYSTMAAVTRMGGMLAGHEIDLLICDAENAQRYGESGESFVPLAELFTEEEIAALGIIPATVPVLDGDGNPTGDRSAPCGVDLSGNTALETLLGQKGMSAYVIIDTANLDNARAALQYLNGLQ